MLAQFRRALCGGINRPDQRAADPCLLEFKKTLNGGSARTGDIILELAWVAARFKDHLGGTQ